MTTTRHHVRTPAHSCHGSSLNPDAIQKPLVTTNAAMPTPHGDGADVDPIPMLRLVIARFLGIDTAPKTRRHI